jgi:NAD(P)-dependent dehydrogenase (short-subunit alcohol dehydrogenase family)
VRPTERRFGRLDVMLANAATGILCQAIEMSLADWRRQTAVNLDGVFLSVKYAVSSSSEKACNAAPKSFTFWRRSRRLRRRRTSDRFGLRRGGGRMPHCAGLWRYFPNISRPQRLYLRQRSRHGAACLSSSSRGGRGTGMPHAAPLPG